MASRVGLLPGQGGECLQALQAKAEDLVKHKRLGNLGGVGQKEEQPSKMYGARPHWHLGRLQGKCAAHGAGLPFQRSHTEIVFQEDLQKPDRLILFI